MSEPYWVPLTGVPSVGPVPACRVFNSAAISLTSGASTPVPFDSERRDTDNIHDPAVNPTRLTCRTAGKYLIFGTAGFLSNATGQRQLRVKLNGSTQYLAVHEDTANATYSTYLEIATVYDLAVGDYVELEVIQDSGGALNLLAAPMYSPEFGMIRIDVAPGGPPLSGLPPQAWTAYVPAWSCASGAAPVLGNGSLSGRYQQFGKLVVGNVYFGVGSTTTFGGGVWRFSLPVPQQQGAGVLMDGDAMAYKSSNANLCFPQFRSEGGGLVSFVYPAAAPIGAFTQLDATHPWAWLVNDSLMFNFAYEAA